MVGAALQRAEADVERLDVHYRRCSTGPVPAVDVGRLYSDVLDALGTHARSGRTALGAAAVVKRVALAHGLEAARSVPLPRLTRDEQAEAAWRRSRSRGG